MRYLVHWTPERHGCFSLFAGELFVEPVDEIAAFTIALCGNYARDLLTRIGRSIEIAFEADAAWLRVLEDTHVGTPAPA